LLVQLSGGKLAWNRFTGPGRPAIHTLFIDDSCGDKDSAQLTSDGVYSRVQYAEEGGDRAEDDSQPIDR
jgi:hypothetical protein